MIKPLKRELSRTVKELKAENATLRMTLDHRAEEIRDFIGLMRDIKVSVAMEENGWLRNEIKKEGA
jgi:hypothetical protein